MFGVMVPLRVDVLPFATMLRYAAFGAADGKAPGPPTRGVKPGVKPLRGVRPVRKLAGSNARWEGWSCDCCGPANMAGERGPDRSELRALLL